jgi:hypothetical protein
MKEKRKKGRATAEIQGNDLVVRIPLEQKLLKSQSGKTLIVASTFGPQLVEAKIREQLLRINLTAYVYPNNFDSETPLY